MSISVFFKRLGPGINDPEVRWRYRGHESFPTTHYDEVVQSFKNRLAASATVHGYRLFIYHVDEEDLANIKFIGYEEILRSPKRILNQ